MIKNISLCLVSALLACCFIGCNSKSDDEEFEFSYANVIVKSFSLQADSKVLNNLDSVYFSIDLPNAQIFNADSLPYGTKISRLIVNIETDNCSKVELRVPKFQKAGEDSVIDYIAHPTDSVNFANGPVTLHLESLDQKATRDYIIKVNVHKSIPDSIYWNELAGRSLPGSINSPSVSKTVKFKSKAMCFTADGNYYCIASSSNPGNDDWTYTNAEFSFSPALNSLTATDDKLFILDSNGDLYESTDGLTWNACGVNWLSITAAYGDRLLGIRRVQGVNYHVTYPATTETAVDRSFPVTGNSHFFRYTTEWSDVAQIITVGGRTGGGVITGDTWAYDGSSWAKLTSMSPFSAEEMTVFPYYCCETDTNTWVTTDRSVFVAMGGRNHDGSMQRNVYISYDLGFNWKLADEKMQLPADVPATAGSQALVFNSVLHARSAARMWTDFMLLPLPEGWEIDDPVMSRAIRPITEWDTPYIYMFGGYKADRSLNNTVWRGVLNRLTFKPLQ